VRQLLTTGNVERIAELAAAKKSILGTLVTLTYDPDTLLAWRAVEAMGAAADRIAAEDPDAVREHVRKLNWLITEESGGICWRAPECMAEIVRHRPDLLEEFIPIIVSLIVNLAEEDLGHFRCGALWAIGRLGAVGDRHVEAVLPAIEAALGHEDPQVRGLAVWCLQQVGRERLLADRQDLWADDAPLELYEQGELKRTRVCALVERALTA
jgi:hypothetical protein